jgi:hypothetical protein
MIALLQMYQINTSRMIALIDYRMIPILQMYQTNNFRDDSIDRLQDDTNPPDVSD